MAQVDRDREDFEHLLKYGSMNELRCYILESATDSKFRDELHYEIMEILELVFERGMSVGRDQHVENSQFGHLAVW